MKLLTPKDISTTEDTKLTLNLKRSSDLDVVLNKKRLELDKLEADFQLSIESQRLAWEKDKQKLTTKVEDLKANVEKLEEKRKDLLVPLDQKWAEIALVDKKIKEREILLDTNKEALDSNLEALQARLSDVSDREIVVKDLEQKLTLRQQGIEDQKKDIERQVSIFNSALAKSQIEWQDRTNALVKREAEIEADRKYVETIRANNLKREMELNDKERQLVDRYATLERTIKRTNAK